MTLGIEIPADLCEKVELALNSWSEEDSGIAGNPKVKSEHGVRTPSTPDCLAQQQPPLPYGVSTQDGAFHGFPFRAPEMPLNDEVWVSLLTDQGWSMAAGRTR